MVGAEQPASLASACNNHCLAPTIPPTCARNPPLPALQEVTDQIRQRTGHLPGVSIAVMGCIVNGPGEMADADFG